MNSVNHHTSLAVVFEAWAIDSAGNAVNHMPAQRNLITDVGLDLIASLSLDNVIRKLYWGEGALITNRTTGALTVNAVGGRLYASGNVFESGDAGRVFKFNSGEECRITAYVSATEVVTSNTATIAAAPGKVWYVNLTSLMAELGNTTATTSPAAATTPTGGMGWCQSITFLTPAFATTKTITELAWGPSGVATKFGIKDIVPFGVGATQQLKVTVSLYWSHSPSALVNITPAGSGIDPAGTFSLDCNDCGKLQPSAFTSIGIMFTKVALNQTPAGVTYPDSNNWTGGSGPWGGAAPSAYVAGAKAFTITYQFAAGAGLSGSYTGFAWAWVSTGDWTTKRLASLKFTAAQTITSNDKVTIVARISWDRLLVN